MNKYRVSLYPGAGYWLESVEVDAYHEENALELAVVNGCGYIINEHDEDFYEYLDDESWYYIDLSEYDKPNCLVLLDNAHIEKIE